MSVHFNQQTSGQAFQTDSFLNKINYQIEKSTNSNKNWTLCSILEKQSKP
jgi:hypothetical protein